MCALPLSMALWFFLSATALCLVGARSPDLAPGPDRRSEPGDLRSGSGARSGDRAPTAMEAKPGALLRCETRNGAASRRQANHNESAANLHRRRIQSATNLHPTSLTIAD